MTAELHPWQVAGQLLAVTSNDWHSPQGVLRRFERSDPNSSWQQSGVETPVALGRNGLAWGRGLHPAIENAPKQRREGDGCSPAGIFRLPSAFGLDPIHAHPSIRLPYRQITDDLECVDDPDSIYYNTLIRRRDIVTPDWRSSEKMQAIGEEYRLGVVVDHNSSPCRAGCGSCIFLHVWISFDTHTSGCTAMSFDSMRSLLEWLNPERHPILVQLPASEWSQRAEDWNLPAL
ncbi:MAG: hypothetical protein H7X97_03950 [Opitutaceae bacterium]|nr:hypothetical protein [Verrucomicrobiales bacterium]